jgi:hypothetical protein
MAAILKVLEAKGRQTISPAYLITCFDSTIFLELEATAAELKHTIIHQFMSLIHSCENSYNEN